jgi:plastin-1
MATQVIPTRFLKDLTPKDIDTCKHLFTRGDRNRDGKIDASELKKLLEELGENVSEMNVADLLKEIDTDSNGSLSLEEFLQCVVNLRKGKVTQFGSVLGRRQSAYTAKTVESESGAKHTYSEEEKIAFADHINRTLKNDSRLADRLPMNVVSDDLFKAVGDGILLCKLMNKAVPDTVDERAMNSGKGMNIYQMNENQNLVINAAKAIGCKVVNIHNEDLIEGKEHLVLGLVWQIVRIQLLSQINLKEHPELVRLLEPGEELSDLLKLPADQLLLRWINFHLKNAGETRRVKNFSDDLKDSHAYTILLNQIDPAKCDKLALQQTDPTKRAELVIDNSKNLGVESFIRPENIVTGNARLNLAFCAQIFNTNPGLQISEQELVDMAGLLDDDVGDSREERVFRMWINSLGVEDLYVNNLFEDLRDGVVLLQLMDKIEPGSVSWKTVNRPPKNKYKRVENTNYVVVLGKSKRFNFSLVGIGGVDIVDGNKKLILSIVWQLMRYHSLKVLSSLSADGSLASDRDILTWANSKVQRTGKETRMASFRDSSLADSVFFLDLCSALAPGVVNPEIVTAGKSEEDKVSNAKYVISVARKIGACVFLTWEDIVEVKSKMLMTFTASLMAWDQSAPGQAL